MHAFDLEGYVVMVALRRSNPDYGNKVRFEKMGVFLEIVQSRVGNNNAEISGFV